MSRVGKKPIAIPPGVTVKMNGQICTVKGSRGELKYEVPGCISVDLQNNVLSLKREGEDRFQRALHGLARALIANMITGVSVGFKRSLVIEGIGYRAQAKGDVLSLSVGHSHPVEYQVPKGISLAVEKNVITIEGSDKQVLGQTAADIRNYRKVEPYLGKGIRYSDEVVRRKAGKVGT
jgi:large subunit ribosomal protein L6